MEICNHTEMVGQLRLPMDIADYAQGPDRQITAQRNVVNASPSLEAQRRGSNGKPSRKDALQSATQPDRRAAALINALVEVPHHDQVPR